jgi:hypothetical protein
MARNGASDSAQSKRGQNGAAGSNSGDTGGLLPDQNPDALIAVTPMMPPAGGSGGSGGGNNSGSGDGCEVGKFCTPNVPDPDNCGSLQLKTDVMMVVKPGSVLVVFDRSTSMMEDWGGTPKYQAAGNALSSALTPLKDYLTVGGVFFPSPEPDDMTDCPDGCDVANPIHWIPGPGACCLNGVAGSCIVNTIDQPDQINWTPADMFITALPMHWFFNGIAETPLEAGIMRANEAISARTSKDPLVVLVMTDGEPNCTTNTQNVVDQITTWHKAGVPTYVVGLPGAQQAADLLNMFAAAGGTNMYIDPSNPQDLEAQLKTVISTTVRAGFDNCTFHLDPAAMAPEKLHLIVTQNGMDNDIPRDWSMDAHWEINSAGDQVDLKGQLCDMAKDGTFEALRFVYGCVITPPPPPPPPPVLN